MDSEGIHPSDLFPSVLHDYFSRMGRAGAFARWQSRRTYNLACVWCGQPLVAQLPYAKYHPSCRQKAYWQRRRDKAKGPCP